VQEGRVHRSLYTDPAIFAEEMIRIFGGTWVYLGHESEIGKPNDFVTRNLGLRPIILTRDGGGKINALMNRCSHRAATVCRQREGSARYFTCGYHGWTYSNSGQCVSVPGEDAYGPGFRIAGYDLAKVARVETYRGFIFGTLNREAPNLVEHLGAAQPLIDQWLDRYPGAEVVVRSSAQRMVMGANWKLVYDNAGDGYHPPFSHRSLLAMTARRHGPDRDMSYYGTSKPDDCAMYTQAKIAGVAGAQPIYLYQTVDYIAITPERGYGRPGGTRGPKVNQQFEASAFTHGPDGKPVNIGRVGPLTWDVAERVSRIGDDDALYVGKVDPYGTFIAAADGPNPEREHSESNVGDVWVEAWYKPDPSKPPMGARAFMLLMPPKFVFNPIN